ncbi:MAG: hypothetical protein JKX83_02585 [Pseudomonadales bacterium]|nr:hypothetical protein [Pseudomonadales bacterium]
MPVNQVTEVVHENEQAIKELADNMHISIAGIGKNKTIVEAIWNLDTPDDLTASYYDVPHGSTNEEMCLIGLDLVEDHHPSGFGVQPWLDIRVHGCDPTINLKSEFHKFGNTTITEQDYGFNSSRPDA